MPTRIDAFAHYLPAGFRNAMLDVHPTDELRNMWFDQLWDVEQRLEDMGAFGIDKQVLTLANNLVCDVADEYPDRFVSTATLPLVDADYVEEFDRCVQELDGAGVQIFSNVEGRAIDTDAHMALYRTAERADVPVWVHPQFHEWYGWLDEFELRRALGWPFDTSVAMARLV